MADISQVKLPGDDTNKNIKALKLPYGECSTTASTAAKTVTVKSDNNSSGNNAPFVLENGAIILVRFTVTNTAAVGSLTLSVNGTTAKAIKYRNTDLSSAGTLAAGRTYMFTYDGTYWQIIGDLNTDTDTKVTQTSSSSDTDFPILLAASSQTSTSTTYFSSDVIINPSGPQIKCGWNNPASSFAAIDMSGPKGSVGFKSHFEQANGTTLEYQRSCIRAIPGKVTGDAGLLLKIDSGGMVIIGSGESGLNLTDLIDDDQSVSGAAKLNIAGALNTSYVGDDEQMIVASDNDIYFITNCQTIADRKAAALTASLEFHPDTTGTGAIGTSGKHWNTAYINTINGNLTGNVTGNCSGNANTATQAYHTAENPPSSKIYGITFHTSANTSENKGLLTNNGLRLSTFEGTTSDLGYGCLILGNATASGTAGNKYGAVRFFTTGMPYLQFDSSLDTTTLRFSHSDSTTGANFSPKTTDKYDIGQSSLRWRNIYTTTIDNSGSYFIVNGTRIYVGSTAPTGTIPEGSLWLNTAVINS